MHLLISLAQKPVNIIFSLIPHPHVVPNLTENKDFRSSSD